MASVAEGEPRAPYVSTGQLPAGGVLQELVEEAHELYRATAAGEVSNTYPALARVPGHLFGIGLATADGRTFTAGDAGYPFAIMSVSKAFMFAMVGELLGPEALRRRIGVNSTGLPFNSVAAIERAPDGRTNPMVNSGAIATSSLVPGHSLEAKWSFVHEGLSRFAGRDLALDEEIYASASATNSRNKSIAVLLEDRGRLYCDPFEAVDLCTKQCSVQVTSRDLAVMGATLADGGVNPLTKERVVGAQMCHYTLAVMLTAGLYETSGEWLYRVGFPPKAASVAESSPSLPARAPWPRSRHRSILRATASRVSWQPAFCLPASAWIC